MGFRQISWGCRPPKHLTDGVPSNIWGLYTPKIFHGWGFVKYLGALHPQNISRMGFRQIFGGSAPPKMFDGWGSVKYLGAVEPQNISRLGFRQIFGGVYSPQIFHGWGSVKYLGGLIKKRHMINPPGSKTDKETCKCAGNYDPPFEQCRDTLSPATHKETAYDQSSWFKNGQRNLQMWAQLRSTMTLASPHAP